MKKLPVLISAILMGGAFSVNATTPPPPPTPIKAPVYTFVNPALLTAEKGAYAGLEGAMQEGEAFVFSTGCPLSPRTFDMSVSIDETGTGTVSVGAGGVTQFSLAVKPGVAPIVPIGGSVFSVAGNSTNHLFGNALPNYNGSARYSAGGAMMTLTSTFGSKTINNGIESMAGLIIKDFYKVNPLGFVPSIFDWGLQSVHKNTIPQDKWWQRSLATRSDNQIGKTTWNKERIFSAKTMSRNTCFIDINLTGSNDVDGFFQNGTFVVHR